MSKSFKTYHQLVAEKEQLQQLLEAQKKLIRADIAEIKLQVKPLSEIRSQVKRFTASNVIRLLLTLKSDVIFKKVFEKIITARAGWLGKVLVPYLLKKYSSSGFFTEQKEKITRWFKWLLRKEFKEPAGQPGSSPSV
jgi:hypothetical protein